jgi:hypothetical protein
VLRQVADTTVNKRPPIPHGCPEQLAAMKSDCLLGDPQERPSFEELDKRLRRIDAKDFTGKVKSGAKNANVSLFDIFPKHIAEALRDGKKVEAEHKDMVTVSRLICHRHFRIADSMSNKVTDLVLHLSFSSRTSSALLPFPLSWNPAK